MRLFLTEYLCSGAWPEPHLHGSLIREGRAMLLAILEDLRRIENLTLVTTWDHRLGQPPSDAHQVHIVHDAGEERQLFAHLVKTTEATFLIAPEFDDILARRVEFVESQCKPVVGASSPAVRRCADKLELSRHLKSHGISTIETWPLEPKKSGRDFTSFPVVIKPRYGAGSQETYKLETENALEQARTTMDNQSLLQAGIVQPFFSGRSVSVALIMDDAGNCRHLFPPAEQILSDDGQFRYLGGLVPATCPDPTAVKELAASACRSIPGLRGYAGVDIIIPDKSPHRPMVVEINPRLTTSYLGYRRLTTENLAARILLREDEERTIAWSSEEVSFAADGTVVLDDCSM